jgi:deazaflavin-dependent oxidoreductase (nitroreductase family)
VALCSFEGPETRGLSRFSGGLGEGETPLPIPNREVKPLSADGTWLARAWESRTPPVSSPHTRAAHSGGSRSYGSPRRERASTAYAIVRPPTASPKPHVGSRLWTTGYDTRMSRLAGLYARVSPKLAHRPGSTLATRAHARIHRATRGRIGGRVLGADVLTLRTTGRRSGQPRDSPIFYIQDGGSYAVVASNAGSRRPPAWWLNLQAQPQAEANIRGVVHQIRARPASDSETAALWPRFVAMYAGYDHYRSIATRSMPVVILESR